jgi:hypothetical protein
MCRVRMARGASLAAVSIVAAALAASQAPAQPCIPIVAGDRVRAMTRALASETESLRLDPADSSPHIPITHDVRADSAGLLDVLIGGPGGISGALYVALAGPGRLCNVQPRSPTLGRRVDVGAAQEWNEAVAEVAPRLRIAGAVAARRMALAALSYATGYAWDTVWTSADAVAGGWNVSGMMSAGGWRRLFFVRLAEGGRVATLFLQYPPDPPAVRRATAEGGGSSR